jgi:hypothetical protein
MQLSLDQRRTVELDLAGEILDSHRQRRSQGMVGGFLTTVQTCSWCGFTWPCTRAAWANDTLAHWSRIEAEKVQPLPIPVSPGYPPNGCPE